MRPWVLGFWCALVLCGYSSGLAQQQQQQTGLRTLETLLKEDGETQSRRPSVVDASVPAAVTPLPSGRIQGAVARPKEGVRHPDLDAAWTEYDEQVETVAKAIEQAIEKELKAAAEAGDLDAALKWKTAGEQFKKDGRIPEGMEGTKPQGRPKPRPIKPAPNPQSLLAEAQGRLAKAYEAVEKELVKSLDLEKAKQVRAERHGFRPPDVDMNNAADEIAARHKMLAAVVGKWRHPNGNLEEIRADGRYLVNGDPRSEWSGKWFLDMKDPQGPCVVREANNKTSSRFYIDPHSPNTLERLRRER